MYFSVTKENSNCILRWKTLFNYFTTHSTVHSLYNKTLYPESFAWMCQATILTWHEIYSVYTVYIFVCFQTNIPTCNGHVSTYNYHNNEAFWESVGDSSSSVVRSVPSAQVLCGEGQSSQGWLCLMRGSPWSSIQDRVPWPSSTNPPSSGLQLLLRPTGTGWKLGTYTQVTSCGPYLW